MRFVSKSICALTLGALLLGATWAAADEHVDAPTVKQPMLYAAVGAHATLLIEGTLHVPDVRVTRLTAAESAALDHADELWAEVDFSGDVRMQITPYVRLPRNRDLESVLGDELTARVRTILEQHGESLSSWSAIKPWMLDVYIGLLFAPRETVAKTTLDEVLFAEMKKRGKPVGGLESVYEQISLFDRLKLKDQVALLDSTVSRLEQDMKTGRNSVETMVKIFLSGDTEELLTEVESYFDFDLRRDRDLYEAMHAKRNVRMLERLETKARAHPGKTRFVAVGAAHLGGKQGMLRLLEQSGYVVWRIASVDDVPVSREAALARALGELKRQNAGLTESLRSLESRVTRLRDRMDKTESRDAAKKRRAAPPAGGNRCRPRRRRRCCLPCPPRLPRLRLPRLGCN